MPLNLLSWYNLVFIIPFGLALLYLGLFVFTGITFGDADADIDTDVDADVDGDVQVEATIDADADADLDHDVDADHDLGGDHDADTGQGTTLATLAHADAGGHAEASMDTASSHPLMAVLTLLGIGKIPISLALMIAMLSWGAVGIALNSLLGRWLGASAMVGFITIPITLVLCLTITGLCAALIAKIIPTDDAKRERRQDLVGKAGEALYDIDGTFGMASVRGAAGDFFQIPCRTPAGKSRIPKGSRIVIFDYDRDAGIFHVAPYNA